MEKASKKASEIKIEMKDGSFKHFDKLVEADLVNVKCNMDGGLNLIRGIISDDPDGMYIERRMFKRNPAKVKNAKVCMGNLSLPNTKEKLLELTDNLSCYWKGARIDYDASLMQGEALSQDDKTFIALTKKASKEGKQSLSKDEKKFMALYVANLGLTK